MKKLGKILGFILLITISIMLLVIGNGYNMYKQAVEAVPIDKKVSSIREKENYVSLSALPQMYIDAVISVEDHRFYRHSGIDVIAIGRAFINDVKAMSFVEGGSTITQQIAKNEYFTQEKKITRKIAEVFMAFDIEKKYDKNKILELYINTIYFGNGYYNIIDASLGYFGKLPKDMTDEECIMLAGIPNAPSAYNPKENVELARQRQKQVINKMIDHGYLEQEKANQILKQIDKSE